MTTLTLNDAKAHVYVDYDEDDFLIQDKLEAAELRAAEFMGRYFYQDEAQLLAAQNEVASILDNSRTKMDELLNNASTANKGFFNKAAKGILRDSEKEARMRMNGLVINAQIRAGVLLILGYLFESREDSELMPKAAEQLLQPYRKDLGV